MDPTSLNMKIQSKQLEHEAQKFQKMSQQERNKARIELKKGNRAAAQMYAKQAVMYEQQQIKLLQNAGAVNGYTTDLRQGQVQAQMSKTMDDATKHMQKTSNQVNLNKVAANRNKMDGINQKLGAAHVLLTGDPNQANINAAADDLLYSLDDEIQMQRLMDQGLVEIPLNSNMYGTADSDANLNTDPGASAPSAIPAMMANQPMAFGSKAKPNSAINTTGTVPNPSLPGGYPNANIGTNANIYGNPGGYPNPNMGTNTNIYGIPGANPNIGTNANIYGNPGGYPNSNIGTNANIYGNPGTNSNIGTSTNIYGNPAANSNIGTSTNIYGNPAANSNIGTSTNIYGNPAANSNIGTSTNIYGNPAANTNANITSNPNIHANQVGSNSNAQLNPVAYPNPLGNATQNISPTLYPNLDQKPKTGTPVQYPKKINFGRKDPTKF